MLTLQLSCKNNIAGYFQRKVTLKFRKKSKTLSNTGLIFHGEENNLIQDAKSQQINDKDDFKHLSFTPASPSV